MFFFFFPVSVRLIPSVGSRLFFHTFEALLAICGITVCVFGRSLVACNGLLVEVGLMVFVSGRYMCLESARESESLSFLILFSSVLVGLLLN